MITIYGDDVIHDVKPTIFPDGTSQVWKLPEWVLTDPKLYIEWHFEAEREIIDLLSLFTLLPLDTSVCLSIPYLPYARQDKAVDNNATFNLTVLCDLLEGLACDEISTVDVHKPHYEGLTFNNVPPTDFHKHVMRETDPDFIVFPDLGARNRYSQKVFNDLPIMIFRKERDQTTGELTSLKLSYKDPLMPRIVTAEVLSMIWPGAKLLIVDDICDGGATFIAVAKYLRNVIERPHISLCVTHGIFSKGRDHLLNNGIDAIYTTNSLLRNNKDGFPV